MPRLIDELRARDARLQMPQLIARQHEQNWIEYTKHISVILMNQDLPVLLIDNVADYYYSSEQEHWDLGEDFPNLAPPYRQFWCEHRLPKTIHSKECGDTDVGALCHGRVGTLFTALEPGDYKGTGVPDNVRWILWADIFIDYGERGIVAQGPHSAMFLAIDAEGRLVDAPWCQSMCWPEANNIATSLVTWLHPALLAVSFLHCKNVTVVENESPKPLAKKHHARTGQWPTRWRTLVIEPMKQVLRREGGHGQGGSLQRALHICRGHFRDYREGRGLFGKYHQLVWTPSIVRGSKGTKAPPREVKIKV